MICYWYIGDTISPVAMCRDKFSAFYLRQVDDRAWPPVKSTNFINLALIKDQTSWRKTVPGSVDEIVCDKEATSYQKMLDDIEHLDCKFILMEGRPGSGKTTLINKISCDWASGEILQSKLVIYVPLRRLNNEPDRSLSTILRIACPTGLSQGDHALTNLVLHIENQQGEGVVFAFDGLDEYKPYNYEVRAQLSLLSCWRSTTAERIVKDTVFEVLYGNKLTKAIIIVTSRPAACTDFRQYAGKRIEVLGFLKPQITEYISHYFDNDKSKAKQLMAHLEKHPNLLNMAYLPLHCTMLTFLYEEDEVLPKTETDFYKHFTLSTLLRSIRKRQGRILQLPSFDQLPPNDKVLFDKICKLAFNATVDSRQVFTSSDYKKITGGKESGESSLGLIVTDRYFMRTGLDETYTFLHLTFQEYLAAVHIVGLSESEQKELITTNRDNTSFSILWRFLCGMMNFQSASAMDIFKLLLDTTSDPLLQICYAYESQDQIPCIHVINNLGDRVRTFRHETLSPSSCAAIVYVNKASKRHELDLSFEKCSFNTEGVVALLHQIGDHPCSLKLR